LSAAARRCRFAAITPAPLMFLFRHACHAAAAAFCHAPEARADTLPSYDVTLFFSHAAMPPP
jgi:hypothetical protein